MERRKRRNFTEEFKAGAVRLVREGTSSLPQVAKDLDLTESALRIWVRQADEAEGNGAAGALRQAEWMGRNRRAAAQQWCTEAGGGGPASPLSQHLLSNCRSPHRCKLHC
jgi:transposase-like protein